MIIFHLCIEENDDREAFIKVNWSDIFSLEGYLSLAFLLALYFIPLVGLFYWLIDNKENSETKRKLQKIKGKIKRKLKINKKSPNHHV